MALQLGDKGICERCQRVVPLAGLNDKGFCGACAVAERIVPEMALAASLDMEAIVRDVVEAGMLDVFRKKKPKTIKQLLEEQRTMFMDIGEKESDKAMADIQKGIAAPWKELRK